MDIIEVDILNNRLFSGDTEGIRVILIGDRRKEAYSDKIIDAELVMSVRTDGTLHIIGVDPVRINIYIGNLGTVSRIRVDQSGRSIVPELAVRGL